MSPKPWQDRRDAQQEFTLLHADRLGHAWTAEEDQFLLSCGDISDFQAALKLGRALYSVSFRKSIARDAAAHNEELLHHEDFNSPRDGAAYGRIERPYIILCACGEDEHLDWCPGPATYN